MVNKEYYRENVSLTKKGCNVNTCKYCFWNWHYLDVHFKPPCIPYWKPNHYIRQFWSIAFKIQTYELIQFRNHTSSLMHTIRFPFRIDML